MTRTTRSRRRVRRVLAASAAVILAIVIAAPLVSSEIRYLLRAGYEEARILTKRRSLESLIAHPETSPQRRDLFRIVLEARAFAAESLGLEAGETYTSFSDVGRDTLLLVISASPRNELAPYLWRYPIVGAVPYKGFFKATAAREAAARLEAEDLDTYVRPAGAFSTLGWFNDPLLSTALYRDSVNLVATVLHEIAHNTLYVPSASHFNESWASFVGYRAAAAFFLSRGDSTNEHRARSMWNDELQLALFYETLATDLESLYASGLPEGDVLSQRGEIFAAARTSLVESVGPHLESYNAEYLARRPLNNASIIAARIYRTRLTVFDEIFVRHGGDIAVSVAAITAAVTKNPGVDPYQVLVELASK